MHTIAICNHKGGSGKTTTAVNLAAALGETGKRTLLIDLDAQCSATRWHGLEAADRGLYEVFTDDGGLEDLIQATEVPGVAVVPSSAWLAGVEKALAREIGAETTLRRKLARLTDELAARAATASWEPEVVSTTDYLKYGTAVPMAVWEAKYREATSEERERMRKEKLRKETELSRAVLYDFVLVDCPPAMGALQVNALTAADTVVVPVEAHFMALVGLAQVVETVDRVKERLNPALGVEGILACRVDSRTRHGREVVEGLRGQYGPLVFRTVIRENVRLAECPGHRKPVTLYDSRSAGAEDYRALAAEVLERSP